MADEAICGGSVDTDYDRCDVSAVAGKVEDWGLVPQYGFPWTDWPILRDGYLPSDTFLCNCVYGAAWTLAVSEPIRRRRFL